MRKRTRHSAWKGRIESLEDRRVMSADPLLGGSIEHHTFVEEAPPIEHQQVSEPDFWLDVDNLISLEDQLDQIEQTLQSAHGTTGLNSVVTNYGFTGIGQTVAVIDSGIAYDHFALGGGFGANYKVVGGWDFTGENDANPYDDGPSGSHGTHVAGIVGGTAGNDKGVAPGVDLVALRVFDDSGAGYFSWVENALKWVIQNRTAFENPITAINLSLGVSSWNSNSIPGWSTLEDEFATLKAAGVFIAVSAGNGFGSFNTPGLSYPAASPHVVPVMSVTDSGTIASYSQRATHAIAAPGSAIRSTVPDYKGNNNNIADDYANFSGTSMAAPYIAGASVLIRQAMQFAGYTNITQDTIYNHMMSTATSFVDSVTGLTLKRLNLGAAIDALMPADDYGSTVATAHNMGTLTGAKSFDGTIGKVSDIDYFKFTASANARVTFAVSDSTHNMNAAWTLSGGTGTVSNNGDTFAFDVAAGQTYTVGLSSSSGIGHYALDVTSQNTFTDWGTVSFSERNNLSVSGEAWYRVTASQAGYLTVEGLYAAQSGQVSMQLFNTSMQTLATGNAVNGTCRVDTYATAGQQFYVRVIGTNSDVDYRLSNLVSVSGTTVTVGGTSGNDTFAFTAGATHTVTVNGVRHTFSSTAVNTFNFAGGNGADTIVMTGTSGNETATLRVGTATLTGSGFTASTTSIEFATAQGGGGADVANLYDSAGDDVFGSWFNQAYIHGNGYRNDVRGFSSTLTQATAGGYDQATFYDTAGDDTYTAWFNQATMAGAGYRNEVRGFDRTLGQASSGGNDQATFYDTVGDDSYVAWLNQSYMYGTGYWNEVRGFDGSIAHATSGGYDQATFYDTAGDDVYVAWFNQAYMYGNGYRNEVRGFDNTIAHAKSGGFDQATFYDTAGDDVYGAWLHQSYMYGNGYRNEVRGFDRSNAYATSGGNDQANFYDTAGDDIHVAWFNQAYMYGNGYKNEARGFGRTNAYANSGGDDQAEFYDTAGDDVFVAWFNQVSMTGTGYRNESRGFDRNHAYANSGGIDQAVFYDTVGNDLYAAWSNRAVMSGLGYINEALQFERTIAHAVSGGIDRAEFYDSVRDDVYSSWSNRAVMYSGSYLNDARGFEVSVAQSTQGGNDRALMYDSTGNDSLIARSWGVSLTGPGYYSEARNFKHVTAQLINGGTNTVDAQVVDYIFELVGQWN